MAWGRSKTGQIIWYINRTYRVLPTSPTQELVDEHVLRYIPSIEADIAKSDAFRNKVFAALQNVESLPPISHDWSATVDVYNSGREPTTLAPTSVLMSTNGSGEKISLPLRTKSKSISGIVVPPSEVVSVEFISLGGFLSDQEVSTMASNFIARRERYVIVMRNAADDSLIISNSSVFGAGLSEKAIQELRDRASQLEID